MRLIDANALKDCFFGNCDGKTYFTNEVLRIIDNAPTVEPEKAKEGELVKAYTKGFDAGVETARPQGEWITQEHSIEYYCSHCGERLDQCCENFCCHCGAKMEVITNENND